MLYPKESYNMATGTKWYMYFPLHTIVPNLNSDEVSLNLYNFSLPEISSAEVEFTVGGTTFPLPGHIRNESKELTFNYLLSSNWHQYLLLYKWFSMIATSCGTIGINEDGIANTPDSYTLDLTVMVVSEYKNPLFQITYHNSWIKSLAEVDFNYQDEDEVISHSFTVAYSHYTFEDLSNQFPN